MNTLNALLVSVYTNSGCDGTNKGLSSQHSTLKMVCKNITNGNARIEDNEDYLVCEYRHRFDDFIAIPRSIQQSGRHPMFGGNFIYQSDSRFPSKSPIKIFDRVE